jgi:hypothetical protein
VVRVCTVRFNGKNFAHTLHLFFPCGCHNRQEPPIGFSNGSTVFSVRYELSVIYKVPNVFVSVFKEGCAMSQEVSCRPVLVDTGFDTGPVHLGFMVFKLTLVQVFLRVPQYSPLSVIQPMLCADISSGKRAKTGRCKESSAVPDIEREEGFGRECTLTLFWGHQSAPVQTGPGAHPVSYTMGTGSLSRG